MFIFCLNKICLNPIGTLLPNFYVVLVIIACNILHELLHRGESSLSDLVSVACLYVAQSIAVSLLVSHTLAQFYRSGSKTSVLRYLSECCCSVRRDNERLSVLVTFLSFGFNTSFFLCLFCSNPLRLFLLCLNASLLLFLSTFTLLSGFPFRLRLGGFLSARLLSYDGFPSVNHSLCLRHCRLVFLD